MRNGSERIYLAHSLKKYARLGLADRRVGEYQKIRIIKGFAKTESEFYDLVAVSDLIKVLSATGREEELKAFAAIYMKDSGRRLCRVQEDISDRVLRFSLKYHCDVRTVYRRLSSITSLYIKIRKGYSK